jgi:methylmalonyl-CoA mutase N-terminal domain/subunit
MAAKGLSHWLQDVYGKAVARFGERKDRFISGSGEEIDPLYSADPPEAPVGLPGEYPYTRGVQPTMYRGPAMDHAAVRRLRRRRRVQ